MYYEKSADLNGYLRFIKRMPSGKHSRIVTPHFHNAIELYVCAKGKYCVNVGAEKILIKEGEIAFVDRLTPHSAGSVIHDTSSTVYFVIASNYYLGAISWLEERTLPAFCEKRPGFEKIVQILELASSSEEMNEDIKRGYITLLFGMLKEYCGTIEKTKKKNDDFIVEVMNYINENLGEKITLDTLAKKFGYEKSYFSKIFNKFLGMNLREYLNRCRISAAKRTKQEFPSLPISKIAVSCGFDSPNTYYRAYKKYGDEKHNF